VGHRALLILAGLLALAALAAVPSAAAAATPRPIVYVIVIDGLSPARVDMARAPNLTRLLSGRGANTTRYDQSRSIMPAQTNPNHVAMLTGAYAGDSGILANRFALYAPLAGPESCRPTGPMNFAALPTVTTGETAQCLRAQTVFGAIKAQGNPDRLRTSAVFGKPKLARIFFGTGVDMLWAPCTRGPSGDRSYCEQVETTGSDSAARDSIVMDEVLEQASSRNRPDYTFVNLPTVDNEGHRHGVGPEYDAAIRAADAEIGRLVSRLRARGEWRRTVLTVLSDHAMLSTPDQRRLADNFQAAGIQSSAALIFGGTPPGFVYLADRTSPNRFELLRRMRRAALSNPVVHEVLYREPNPRDGGRRHTVRSVHPTWRANGRGTPDLFVIPKPPGVLTDPGTAAVPGTHGTQFTRHNFFAVISGGRAVRQQRIRGRAAPDFDDTATNPRQSENVDVAATVSRLFGLRPPRNSRGRFLREAFNLNALPGRGRRAR
jgi:predicted AlkP superfamily pyrophosphatase or phosphodiesterase